MNESHDALLAPLRVGYSEILQRLAERAANDRRVAALWLHGSVVKGLADRESDLDVIVTVSDDAVSSFAADLVDWMSEVTPPIYTKRVGARILLFLTPEFRRVDVFVETSSELAQAGDRHRRLVVDTAGVASLLPAPEPAPGPRRELVAELIGDFISELVMMPGVVRREDWLFGLESVHRSRMMLRQLLVESNRPLPLYGNKQWSTQLTSEQRAMFAGLPGVTAAPDSVVPAKWATVEAFYRFAPSVAEALQVEWPLRLESAVRTFLHRELDYELPVRADSRD